MLISQAWEGKALLQVSEMDSGAGNWIGKCPEGHANQDEQHVGNGNPPANAPEHGIVILTRLSFETIAGTTHGDDAVWIGWLNASIFSRSQRTWTSTVRLPPLKSHPHTRSRSKSRVNTCPRCLARYRSSTRILLVLTAEARPSRRSSWRVRSSSRSSKTRYLCYKFLAFAQIPSGLAGPDVSKAFTRACSSRMLKGLVR
jgi:hypothetical protein